MKKTEVLQFTLGIVFTAFILGLFQSPAIPQDLSFHNFADQHHHFGIPNFWNVVSNIPFMVCGPLFFFLYKRISNKLEAVLVLLMGVGFIATGFGSSYYHWSPNNHTLVWDRLPMTLVFVSFFHLLLYRNMSKTVARLSVIPSLIIGVFSVFYWDYTESIQEGDLRMYIFVQFFPLVGTVLILLFNWKSIQGKWSLLFAFACYMGAKVFETQLDFSLQEAIGFSGHSVKHILSAGSALGLYWWARSIVRVGQDKQI